MEDTIREIAILAVPVLFGVIFHEVAHGWVANKLGDPTAARMGRLTLNPISHIDLFGTIILPALLYISGARFLFGYAKPVPVNFNNLRNPKTDMIWVALAGPLTNILLALASLYALKFANGSQTDASPTMMPILLMAQVSVEINVMLATFNLFPIPPLDGGRVLVGLLPRRLSTTVARIEPFGFLIIILLLMTNKIDFILGPIRRLVLGMLGALLLI
ncbi:MAG TPA: site-2 protease family protein [Verrucomicrobiae bacterium]|jgi:Zn-dependent protease|nr:site-2 protease family protein [Verrucomicrobiae bacterium]